MQILKKSLQAFICLFGLDISSESYLYYYYCYYYFIVMIIFCLFFSVVSFFFHIHFFFFFFLQYQIFCFRCLLSSAVFSLLLDETRIPFLFVLLSPFYLFQNLRKKRSELGLIPYKGPLHQV